MSKHIKLLSVVGLLAFTAACSQQEEIVIVEPEPVTTEPTYTGKFN